MHKALGEESLAVLLPKTLSFLFVLSGSLLFTRHLFQA